MDNPGVLIFGVWPLFEAIHHPEQRPYYRRGRAPMDAV